MYDHAGPYVSAAALERDITPVRAAMTGTLTYEVRRARGEEEMAPCSSSATRCSASSRGCPSVRSSTGATAKSLHLVAVAGGEVLATCRLLFVGNTVQFSRLAVRASARRHGIASALLDLADEETRAAGARRLVLHAQTYARSLYEAAGYVPRGRLFMEAGIEHIAMEKYL